MKLVEPFINMLAFFAILHVLASIILALITHNLSFINIFYMESVDEFFPGIEKGIPSLIVSLIIILCVFSFFYYLKDNK